MNDISKIEKDQQECSLEVENEKEENPFEEQNLLKQSDGEIDQEK